MDPLAIALGILALIAVAVCVWLAMGRAKAGADLAGARAELQRVERERADDAAQWAAARTELQRTIDDLAQRAQSAADQAGQVQIDLTRAQEQNRAAEERFAREFEMFEKNAAEQRRAQAAIIDERERKLQDLGRQMTDTFRALAANALNTSAAEFLRLAEEKFKAQHQQAQHELDRRKQSVEDLLKPIAETLQRTDAKLGEIEQARVRTAVAIAEQARAMADASAQLRDETGKLTRALREPHVRGRYGEIQLRRVAELAGMSAYCDFTEQDQTLDPDGQAARPDMIVRLPNDRTVVVDAKTNIQAYLDAINAATPDEAERQLDRFARHVAEQARSLGDKKYWTRYDGSPEFVVMFIPGDQFIDAALSRRSELLEEAAGKGVLLASPSTLIGLLRAVAVGYQEQKLAKAAEELRALGRELHDRAATALAHASRIGKSLSGAVDAYNDFVGSYERRLEPVLRKFEESGVKSAKELPPIVEVNVRPRTASFNEPTPLLPMDRETDR